MLNIPHGRNAPEDIKYNVPSASRPIQLFLCKPLLPIAHAGITTARARRTAKGADFRRTNAFAINTGTPYRMAALRTDCLFPVVQTQEGSGLSLVPATSAGQSETAPGIEND